MKRSSKSLSKKRARVRTQTSTSPTGRVVVVSRRVRRPNLLRELPPCLRAHRATRILP